MAALIALASITAVTITATSVGSSAMRERCPQDVDHVRVARVEA